MMIQSQATQIYIVMRRLMKDQTVVFTASRYLGYAIQFVRGILVATYLGPYFFGIWGFLMLVNQYLSYTSLGLAYAINVELAVDSVSDSERQGKFIRVGFTTSLLIAIILVLLGLSIQLLNVPLFEKYTFSRYALALGMIVGLTHLKEFLTNIYRAYGRLGRIMIGELLFVLLPLLAVTFFRDEMLIAALLLTMAFSTLLALAIFLIKAPFHIGLQFEWQAFRHLIEIGMPLLVYALSFALITIVGRTIVSMFYSVETLGYYSLANNLTLATLLGLRAVTWVVFPDLLSKTRFGQPDEAVVHLVNKVNDLYGTAVFLIVFVIILLAPLLIIVLPTYEPALGILSVLLLTQAVLSVSFGYNCVAIARKKQMRVAVISMLAVVFIVLLGGTVALMQWHYNWVAVIMLGGGFIFTILQARLGNRLINHDVLESGYMSLLLPFGSLVAILFFFLGSVTTHYLLFSSLGMLIFVVSRRNAIHRLGMFAKRKLRVG